MITKNKKYQVVFLVKAIIGLEVYATTPEEAQKLAKEKLNKSRTFAKGVEYINGSETLVGYDDLDAWDMAE